MNARVESRWIDGQMVEFTSLRPRTLGRRRCIQKGGNLTKFVGDDGPGPWEGALYDGCLFEILPELEKAL